MIRKCMDEGRDWRSGIFEMRSQPSGALDGTAPAQMFHGGRMPRSPVLPHLPVDIDTYKIHAHRSWLAEKDAAKALTKAKDSPPFVPGDRVRIQAHEKPMLWDRVGEIKIRKDHGNAYFVKPDDGESLLLRNRRHLKAMEPDTYKLVEEMSPHYLQQKKVRFSEEVEAVAPADTPSDSEEEVFVSAPSSPTPLERDAPFRNSRSNCRVTREEFEQAWSRGRATRDEFEQAWANLVVAKDIMKGREMLAGEM